MSPGWWRWVYPETAIAVSIQDCAAECWTTSRASLVGGQIVGDIALYANPGQMDPVQLSAIEAMIVEAREKALTLVVNDLGTGRVKSFKTDVFASLPYPVKRRIYFAEDTVSMNGSDSYCEIGQWYGSNECLLDISRATVYKVRYLDFAGRTLSETGVTFINQ